MVENGVERAELFEQLPSELRPNQGHTRHIIDRVTHEGLKIDHLFRCDPPFLLHFLPVKNFVLADVENFDPIGDQLPTVFVAGHKIAFAAEFVSQSGNGRQNIVGLVSFAVNCRNAQSFDHATDGRNLRHKVHIHCRPLNLVLVVHGVAKRFAGQVKCAE